MLMLQCTYDVFSSFANENRKNKNHPPLYFLYDCIVCLFQVYTKMCFRVIKKLSIVLGYCTVRKCTCLVFSTYMVLFTYTHNAMEWNLLHTDVHFASFLSGGFTTVAVINPSERKLAKRTPVYWSMVMHFHKGFLHSINLYP